MSDPKHQVANVSPTAVAAAAAPAALVGLRATSKIRDEHLDRLAMVYVRQSSPQQVLENRESRERQYALAAYARRLGWSPERIVVIDEDQGLSGKSANNRAGFQRLMAEVSLNHVGIVLGLELSRLSRSNKDWHQLVDVCGIFNTLLCDQDGVYDAGEGNDRLLLGMKGAMSEFELVTLRNRLLRGTRNKAERGEHFSLVPVGYYKQRAGQVIQDPDEQARAMIRLVFEKFAEMHTVYAVFRYFTVHDLRLGFRRQRGERIGDLEWRAPSPARILGILRHPIYAGAYAFPLHRPGKKNPLTGATEGGKWFMSPDEFPVLIRDRLPAYITWEQYLANQEQLRQNRALKGSRGAPRRGEALLAGLVVCGKCSYRMSTRYPGDKKPCYQCHEYYAEAMAGLPEPCGRISAATLDDLVAREVLRALEPAALELSLRASEDVERERHRRHEQWRLRLERARQEAARAERQYQLAEPDNRLVARTLEARWEEALQRQRQEEEEYDRFLAQQPASLSPDERQRIRSLSENISQLWNDTGTSVIDRKQIVRCVVQQVIISVDRTTELNDVTIVWQGGMTTSHQIPRPVMSFEQLKDYRRLTARIRELHAAGLHHFQIAERLNREGFMPPRRRGVFTKSGIGDLIRRLGLAGELFREDLLQRNEWWIPDLARELAVIAVKVHYWVKRAWIHYRRTPSGKHLIVWADQDELRRLRQLADKKSSWFAAKHPELVVPKKRRAR
jgi:DNA invertase Pin-like site-specific DNA recombinase